MKQIKNLEVLNGAVGKWNISDLAFIRELQFIGDTLIMTFLAQQRQPDKDWPDLEKQFHKITVKFERVRNLNLNFQDTSNMQVTGFDIVDISDNGWEDINFQIDDFEEGRIGFCCKEVEIISISDESVNFLSPHIA
jgi:hypothetical protein